MLQTIKLYDMSSIFSLITGGAKFVLPVTIHFENGETDTFNADDSLMYLAKEGPTNIIARATTDVLSFLHKRNSENYKLVDSSHYDNIPSLKILNIDFFSLQVPNINEFKSLTYDLISLYFDSGTRSSILPMYNSRHRGGPFDEGINPIHSQLRAYVANDIVKKKEFITALVQSAEPHTQYGAVVQNDLPRKLIDSKCGPHGRWFPIAGFMNCDFSLNCLLSIKEIVEICDLVSEFKGHQMNVAFVEGTDKNFFRMFIDNLK